ncbi:AmpG family muropeptide MFS transporter [Aestuariicella hydrocarbonica]|uniref:AmpG family muropeptide MFS transporter n=2 Tax=Pseudomaricurvus hydrocarbonicus TaxID=1470433 RepID=A0A9E5MGT7_9GAMM|nr:AmpG family muropeptide MFS transporter [Aestuariicella hydrocarbonica]NHO65121.1 AmpG family muropeptide MFS transporter [Aestuariicella hydrocarbonica]
MLFLGFAAGLPLLLVFSTMSAWLRDMDVSRSAIGFFGWIGITYSVKVFWSPVVDRLKIPWLSEQLGQRRSWMLLGQLGVIAGVLGMAMTDPQSHLTLVAWLGLTVAFSSATQDVAIDAYRIEAVVREYQGAMSSMYILGYRVAMLVAGAGSLYIADFFSWSMAYAVMAALMLVGVVTVMLIAEPNGHTHEDADELEEALHHQLHLDDPHLRGLRWFVDAVVAPFVDFFKRNGRFALVILLFIGLFRLSDIVMGIMANPFYLDLGFSKTDIASIGKVFGFFMTIIGSFLGGLLVVRYGVFRPLIAGAVMVALTNMLFAQLSLIGPDITWLALVISADNLSGGFSNAVFVAYLSGLTNRAYTATQYALFSSVMTLPGKFVSGFSGVIVDANSYTFFFSYAALMGVPAILLAIYLWRRNLAEEPQRA